MKLDPRSYPLVILAAFILFFLFGLLLGWGPGHGGAGGHGVLLVLEIFA